MDLRGGVRPRLTVATRWTVAPERIAAVRLQVSATGCRLLEGGRPLSVVARLNLPELALLGTSRRFASASTSRQEHERIDMPRPHRTEVAPVQRRHLRFVEPLDYCDNRGIDKSNVRIRIAVAQFPHPPVVAGFQILYAIRTRLDVPKQRRLHPGCNRV